VITVCDDDVGECMIIIIIIKTSEWCYHKDAVGTLYTVRMTNASWMCMLRVRMSKFCDSACTELAVVRRINKAA